MGPGLSDNKALEHDQLVIYNSLQQAHHTTPF